MRSHFQICQLHPNRFFLDQTSHPSVHLSPRETADGHTPKHKWSGAYQKQIKSSKKPEQYLLGPFSSEAEHTDGA